MAIKYGRPIEVTPHLTPVEVQQTEAVRLDLSVRPRRNRKAEWSRRMVRENVLTADDLIWPLFVIEGRTSAVAVASMPGVERLSIDLAVRGGRARGASWHPGLALFPIPTEAARRDGSEAINPDNLVCRAMRAMKEAVPDDRRHLRRGARSLFQPRAGRPGARRRDRQRRDGRDAGAAGAGAGGGGRRHHRAVRHDGRPRRRDADRRSTRRASTTSRSWPTRPSTRPRSTGRSATRSVRRPADRRQAHLSDGPGQRRRGAARSGASTSTRAPTW